MKTIAEKQGINQMNRDNRDGRVELSGRAGEQVQVDRSAQVCSPCHTSIKPKISLGAPFRSRVLLGEDGRRKLFIVTPIYNEPACSQAACHAHPAAQNVLGVLDVVLDLSTVDQELSAMQYRVIL